MELIKAGRRFDFMGMRQVLLCALRDVVPPEFVCDVRLPGPELGHGLQGGTEVEVTLESDKAIAPADVRGAVESSGFAAAEVVASSGTKNRFLIRVQEVSALSDTTKSKLDDILCFSDEAKKDAARCPEAVQPDEVKFSPGGDKIALRYKEQPDLLALGKLMAGVDAVQLREGIGDEGWPKTREEYELKFGAIGVAPKEGDVWPASAEAFATQYGFPAAAVTTFSAHEGDHRIEVHLKSKGDQLLDGLKAKLGVAINAETASVQWIGSKAGEELRAAAFKSILIALVFIMAYIAFRFDLRFAPGGIVSLFHDVLIAIGAMCALRKEISLSTIAAVLTVLGYSITDTVVVYDRIRENLGKHRNMTFSDIVNLSVSEMFGRTILTSGTAALSMVCFLIFGTQVIKDFAFVFLIGVGVGTYSSIYVAAPLTEWIDRRFFASKGAQRGTAPSRQRQQKQAASVV